MSCKECEAKQELAFNKNINETTPIAYVRVDVADIAIVGCRKHLKMLIEKLREDSGIRKQLKIINEIRQKETPKEK